MVKGQTWGGVGVGGERERENGKGSDLGRGRMVKGQTWVEEEW